MRERDRERGIFKNRREIGRERINERGNKKRKREREKKGQ